MTLCTVVRFNDAVADSDWASRHKGAHFRFGCDAYLYVPTTHHSHDVTHTH
jgi:hypothetical protein